MAKVLIVDDDELLRDLVGHKLTRAGFEVTLAVDGEHALELLAAELPDVVVLDAMMPGIDGFEVLRSIRERAELATLPVVMLTARDQEEDVLNGLSLGAQDYIVKPFLPDEVVLRIQRLVTPLRQAS